jgi:hypothetical protein
MAKRKDECFYCSSRKCNHRFASTEDDGKSYDQIACEKHWKLLITHSERRYGRKVTHAETAGRFKRGSGVVDEE